MSKQITSNVWRTVESEASQFQSSDASWQVPSVYQEIIQGGVNVSSLGLSHRATDDDTYQGMRIPRGALLLPNMWFVQTFFHMTSLMQTGKLRQMMRDTKYFERPEDFNPDRFLGITNRYETAEQALNNLYPDDPSSIVFGFGRRSVLPPCPSNTSTYLLVQYLSRPLFR